MKFKLLLISVTFFFTYNLSFAHVTLNYPSSSLSFGLGEEIYIEWSIRQYHGSGTWTLEYTIDNGINWITIEAGIDQGTLSYKWNIPSTPTEMGGIKIIQVNDADHNYSAFSRNLKFGTTTDVTGNNFPLQTNYKLNNAYPNPFNNSAVISYYLPQQSDVEILIYDITGNEIDILENRTKPVGKHELTWDASGVASGTYIVMLKANNFVTSRKLILLK